MDDELRRFSRRVRAIFARARRDEFRLPREAQEIVDALRSVLAGSVVLYDVDKHMHHLARARERWFSLRTTSRNEPRLCYVEARINDRWTLYVCSRRRLHPDAASIAKWAAGKLAVHLPKHSAEPTYPPFGGGGGSGGSAEVGIPVWWARKARS
jgi:hypothetical protein